jgi:acyl-CoA synthetase (NDP forming)
LWAVIFTHLRWAPILAAHSRAGALATIVVQPMLPQGVQLLLGLRNDSAFGSAVVVGLGGTYVEVSREVSLRIGPVDQAQALDMLHETRAGALLAGTRGQGPFDVEAAASVIVALSRFGVEAREAFATIEINPLIVLPQGKGAFGVDVVIEPFATASGQV